MKQAPSSKSIFSVLFDHGLMISVNLQLAYFALFLLPSNGLFVDFLSELSPKTRMYYCAFAKCLPVVMLGIMNQVRLLSVQGKLHGRVASARAQSLFSYMETISRGLILCAIGDCLLDLEEVSPLNFVFGLMAFLFGHVWYMVAFTQSGFIQQRLEGAAVCIAYAGGMFAYLYSSLNTAETPLDLRVPVVIYASVIASMVYVSYSWADVPRGVYWATLIGAIIFVASDSVLAIDKFKFLGTMPYAKIIVMVTYYTAQNFIGAVAPFAAASAIEQEIEEQAAVDALIAAQVAKDDATKTKKSPAAAASGAAGGKKAPTPSNKGKKNN
jgi:uncharacterized membrane protein YhhN